MQSHPGTSAPIPLEAPVASRRRYEFSPQRYTYPSICFANPNRLKASTVDGASPWHLWRINTYIYAYTYMRSYCFRLIYHNMLIVIYTYVHVFVGFINMCINVEIFIHTYIHTYVHTYLHTCIQTYIYITYIPGLGHFQLGRIIQEGFARVATDWLDRMHEPEKSSVASCTALYAPA